jgi:hypothetical protein
MSTEQSCLSAPAEFPFGVSSIPCPSATSPSRKTRTRGFCRHSSGRNLRIERFRAINTPGLRACDYKTAPGQSNWPNRDPIGELGGVNLYAFVANRGPNAIDLLGLCKVGEKSNVKCRPHTSNWLSNPDLDKGKDDLVDLVGDVETLGTVMSMVSVGAGAAKGATAMAEEIIKAVGGEFARPDARKLAKALNDLLNEGIGNRGGWYLWTRIEYEECQPCFFGLSTRWKRMAPTAWKEYKKRGEDGRGTFFSRADAYGAAKAACAEHLKEFSGGSGTP